MSMTLTVSEIIELAEFAGIRLAENAISDKDDLEMEITISDCPQDGVEEDDGTRGHYGKIAYFDEYPEEGVYPLGPKLEKKDEA